MCPCRMSLRRLRCRSAWVGASGEGRYCFMVAPAYAESRPRRGAPVTGGNPPVGGLRGYAGRMDDSGAIDGWRTDLFGPPPARITEADDRLTADAAFRLVSQGAALLWRGDWHNARQLADAVGRRIDARETRNAARAAPAMPAAL